MKFTKKELLVRGPILLIGLFLFGFYLIKLQLWDALQMLIGAGAWEVILFALFRYGIITWKKWY